MKTPDELAAIAVQLMACIRDDSPEANRRYLTAALPDPQEWLRLCFVLAAAIPDNKPWLELTSWAHHLDGDEPNPISSLPIQRIRPVEPIQAAPVDLDSEVIQIDEPDQMGTAIGAIRRGMGITQRQLADKSGHTFSQQMLGRWERGNKMITLPSILRVLNVLGYRLALVSREEA